MTPHPASSTPTYGTLAHDPDRTCFEQARANGEQTFSLRSQDILAPLTIDFWVKANQKARELVAGGLSETDAERAVRSFYFLDEPNVSLRDQKLTQACAIAGKMEQFKGRRLAD